MRTFIDTHKLCLYRKQVPEIQGSDQSLLYK